MAQSCSPLLFPLSPLPQVAEMAVTWGRRSLTDLSWFMLAQGYGVSDPNITLPTLTMRQDNDTTDVLVASWRSNPLCLDDFAPLLATSLLSVYFLYPGTATPVAFPTPGQDVGFALPLIINMPTPAYTDMSVFRCIGWDSSLPGWSSAGLVVMWASADQNGSVTVSCGGLRVGDLGGAEWAPFMFLPPPYAITNLGEFAGTYRPYSPSPMYATAAVFGLLLCVWIGVYRWERNRHFTDVADLARLRLKHMLLYGRVEPDIGRDFVHLDRAVVDGLLAPTREELEVGRMLSYYLACVCETTMLPSCVSVFVLTLKPANVHTTCTCVRFRL